LGELAESWLAVIRLILHDQEGGGTFFADFSETGDPCPQRNSAAVEFDWIQLPTELANWLQNRDGLKIDQDAMNTRGEIESAFLLLHCDETALQSRRIETTSAAKLAIQVACKYTESMIRKRREVILNLTIPGPPRKVVQRKCSSCGRRVLDDAFPHFALKKPAAYVVRTLEDNGCGQSGCKGRVDLVPLDRWQRYIRASRIVLENPPNSNGRGGFDLFLCRSEYELNGLPKALQTVCKVCGSPKFCGSARWTIEVIPQFVMRRLRCRGCQGKSRNFLPVDCTWKTVNSTVLTKTWAKITGNGFDPTSDPNLRMSLLGKVSFSTMKSVLRILEGQQTEQVKARINI
jgi:hypothetical protein